MSWVLAGAVQWMAKPKRSSLLAIRARTLDSSNLTRFATHDAALKRACAQVIAIFQAPPFYNPIHNTLVIGGRYWLSRNSYPARPKEVLGPN